MQLELLRGKQQLNVSVKVVERPDDAATYADLASREENLVPELGIFAVDLTATLRSQLQPVRSQKGGVLVAARHADTPLIEDGFKAGDILYALNARPVASVADLRARLKRLKPGNAVAVQVERAGKLRFISFELP